MEEITTNISLPRKNGENKESETEKKAREIISREEMRREKAIHPRKALMSRIDLVSKNLLANCFRSFSKKDLKRTTIRKV